MSVDRLTRVNELLKREIGSLLFRVMNEGDFDVSAVTVTRVDTGRNLRHARVFVSIRSQADAKNRMLSAIRRRAPEIQQWIGRNVRLKYTPRLAFEIDDSIEEGDRVLRLLSDLEGE